MYFFVTSLGGTDDERSDVANLKDDDDEPGPDVRSASQLHGTPLPQTQTQEMPNFSTSIQMDFHLPLATRARDTLTYFEHHVWALG
jgi:hypothetical protein